MPFNNDILKIEEILKLKKLDTKMLWHSDYWDGPLSGACTVDDEMLWFDILLLIETDPEMLCPKKEECSAKMEADNFSSLDEVPDCPPEYNQYTCYKIHPYRYYGVYRVDDVTMEELKRRHALFQKYVGDYTDYTEDTKGCRRCKLLGAVRSLEEHKVYYDMASTWHELDLIQELIGYFSW